MSKSEITETEYAAFCERNTCQNCDRVADNLRMVHESETPFHVCDDCYDEIQALFEREAEGRELYACDRQIIASFRKPVIALPEVA